MFGFIFVDKALKWRKRCEDGQGAMSTNALLMKTFAYILVLSCIFLSTKIYLIADQLLA
jgi:hypothetical protein